MKSNWQWIVAGFVAGVVAALLFAHVGLRGVSAAQDDLIIAVEAERAETKKLIAVYDEALRQAKEKQAECAERVETRTLLFEYEPAAGISVLSGLLEIKPSDSAAQMLGGPQGRSRARWFIDGKVTPLVYGDSRGTAYAWFPPGAKPIGPFVPESVQRSR